jgi:dUTP pyrophosphatase
MSFLSDDIVLSSYQHLKRNALSHHFAILKLVVNDVELLEIYKQKVLEHNNKLLSNPFMDSGFDLFVPELTVFNTPFTSQFIDFNVKAEMVYCDLQNDSIQNSAFTVHPRSSLSKTPLMLANHTGIIDSGYRGSLIGAFRWLTKDALQYAVEKHTRLVQICHPSLCPIYVVLVDENQLSNTIRGDGGFGSTGV